MSFDNASVKFHTGTIIAIGFLVDTYLNRSRIKRALTLDATNVKGSVVRRLALAFGLLAVFISFSLAFVEYQRQIDYQHAQLDQTAFQMAESFDHELQQYVYSVETLQASAEQALHGRIKLAYRSVDHLYAVSTQNGYALKIPPLESPDVVGNLTGLGVIPAPDSPLAKEFDMALSLSPLFSKLVKLSPNIPWVYYTSAKHFVYLYPRVSPGEYFYQPTLHQKPFYTGALPEKNPLRKTFWSPTYLDEGGKGLMVTVSKPVYDNETFLGSLSVDLSLDTLSWILNQNTLGHTTAFLVNKEGYPIASPKNHPVAHDQKLSALNAKDASAPYVKEFPLRTTDWKVVLLTPSAVMTQEALKSSTVYAVTVLLVLVCVFLILWLSHLFYRVHALSIRDFLTGLYNRRYFDEVAQQEFALARRSQGYIGLALIDIDHFKKYNDTYGHQAGDRVLQQLSEFFTQRVTRTSDKVFRIGGEEFAILAHVQSVQYYDAWLRRLCMQFRHLEIEHSASPEAFLSISIGAVVIGGEHWMPLEQAFESADIALYEAKEEGRGRAVIHWPQGMSPEQQVDAPNLRIVKSERA